MLPTEEPINGAAPRTETPMSIETVNRLTASEPIGVNSSNGAHSPVTSPSQSANPGRPPQPPPPVSTTLSTSAPSNTVILSALSPQDMAAQEQPSSSFVSPRLQGIVSSASSSPRSNASHSSSSSIGFTSAAATARPTSSSTTQVPAKVPPATPATSTAPAASTSTAKAVKKSTPKTSAAKSAPAVPSNPPAINLTRDNFLIVYAAFIDEFHPPVDCSSSKRGDHTLRVGLPPAHGNNTFHPFDLYNEVKDAGGPEWVKKKKMWSDMSRRMGMETKGSNIAKRLKDWVEKHHLNAFFDFLMGIANPFFTPQLRMKPDVIKRISDIADAPIQQEPTGHQYGTAEDDSNGSGSEGSDSESGSESSSSESESGSDDTSSSSSSSEDEDELMEENINVASLFKQKVPKHLRKVIKSLQKQQKEQEQQKESSTTSNPNLSAVSSAARSPMVSAEPSPHLQHNKVAQRNSGSEDVEMADASPQAPRPNHSQRPSEQLTMPPPQTPASRLSTSANQKTPSNSLVASRQRPSSSSSSRPPARPVVAPIVLTNDQNNVLAEVDAALTDHRLESQKRSTDTRPQSHDDETAPTPKKRKVVAPTTHRIDNLDIPNLISNPTLAAQNGVVLVPSAKTLLERMAADLDKARKLLASHIDLEASPPDASIWTDENGCKRNVQKSFTADPNSTAQPLEMFELNPPPPPSSDLSSGSALASASHNGGGGVESEMQALKLALENDALKTKATRLVCLLRKQREVIRDLAARISERDLQQQQQQEEVVGESVGGVVVSRVVDERAWREWKERLMQVAREMPVGIQGGS
ncbi:hypothetical protein HDV05_007261 [Chytridiales sp. JEL 0842]|nr:hypothetical protein HDV05_007261 [Chytridiales sp. JEL 0842]